MTFKNLLIFMAILAGSACEDISDPTTDCIKGEGTIISTILPVADFKGIDLAFVSNVNINQGASRKIEAIGHSNIIEKITTSVSDDVWKIDLESGCYEDYELSVEITIPNINSLVLSGSGNLIVNGFSNQSGKLNLALSGSGNISLNEFVGVSEIDASISGSGNITLNKNTNIETLNVDNAGSGKFSGFELKSNCCTVSSSGSGQSEVTAQNTLDVTISGSGNVAYKGSPSITQSITGFGRLIDAN